MPGERGHQIDSLSFCSQTWTFHQQDVNCSTIILCTSEAANSQSHYWIQAQISSLEGFQQQSGSNLYSGGRYLRPTVPLGKEKLTLNAAPPLSTTALQGRRQHGLQHHVFPRTLQATAWPASALLHLQPNQAPAAMYFCTPLRPPSERA